MLLILKLLLFGIIVRAFLAYELMAPEMEKGSGLNICMQREGEGGKGGGERAC